jgi:hypothetical protein
MCFPPNASSLITTTVTATTTTTDCYYCTFDPRGFSTINKSRLFVSSAISKFQSILSKLTYNIHIIVFLHLLFCFTIGHIPNGLLAPTPRPKIILYPFNVLPFGPLHVEPVVICICFGKQTRC